MQTRALGIDFETHSEADIKLGAYHYATHPSTRIIMMAWHFVGDPAYPALWWHGQPCPAPVADHVLRGGTVIGWNSLNFERQIWCHVAVPQHGFPPMREDQWQDSMLKAVGANLPRSLDGAAKAVGAPAQKDKEGHSIMMELTQAKRTTWTQLWSEAKRPKLVKLAQYCQQDVLAEEATGQLCPEWHAMAPWVRMPAIDTRINDRGIMCDLALVRGMRKASEAETVRLDYEAAKLSNGRVERLTKVQELKGWLLGLGVKLPLTDDAARDPEDDVPEEDEMDAPAKYRLRKNDVVDLLQGKLPGDYVDDRGRLRGHARDMLQMRADAAKISAKKLAVMERAAGADGRLRGALVLFGAQATGRWSGGGGWQCQNFPRMVLPDGDAVAAEVAARLGRKPEKGDGGYVSSVKAEMLARAIEIGRGGDNDLIRLTCGPVLPFVSRMLRRTLCAAPGHTLLQGDFAQVEARITVWLAGQLNILQAFAEGKDVYKIAAAPMVKKDVDALSKEDRQLGKVGTLGLGFGGGIGVFVVMSAVYGIRISREEAKPLVSSWREANPYVVKYWYATMDAMLSALANPGREFPVPPYGLISYFMQGGALCARLPSGRLLRYWAPRIEGKDSFGRPILTVLSVRGKSVTRRKMWSGLALENCVQAIGADLMAHALEYMDQDGGLPVCLHVHDNAVAEVREDQAEALMPRFKAAMLAVPAWARGLPIDADCHIDARFG